jgi:hypothetical protein
MAKFPELRSLQDPRHPGISSGLCEALVEAAEVALARHHAPPVTEFAVSCGGSNCARTLEWREPTEAMLRAWNNRDDTTRDGAYIVAIAAVEAELGLVALLRAETRTGADYYVGDPASVDLERAFRLEVSGLDSGDSSAVRQRLNRKIRQALKGDSNLPAMASVVGFREAVVLVSDVEAA